MPVGDGEADSQPDRQSDRQPDGQPDGHRAELEHLTGWARRLPGHRGLVLACRDAATDGLADGAGPVHVRWPGCLGDLAPHDVAALVASAPKLVLLLCRCRSSSHSTVARLEELLDDLGLGHRLEVQQPETAGEPEGAASPGMLPIRRRDLFSWVRRSADASSKDASRSERRAPTVAGEHGEADGQVRVAAALREIIRQEGALAEGPARAGVPLRALDLSAQGCTACRTCVRACPTDALELLTSEDGRTGQLQLLPEACVGCRQCLALCPVEALREEGRPDWSQLLGAPAPLTLETVTLKSCARCWTAFAGEGERCQVCALRTGNPFGSWLPPGFVAPRVYAPPARDRE